jgi:hypothetical protein
MHWNLSRRSSQQTHPTTMPSFNSFSKVVKILALQVKSRSSATSANAIKIKHQDRGFPANSNLRCLRLCKGWREKSFTYQRIKSNLRFQQVLNWTKSWWPGKNDMNRSLKIDRIRLSSSFSLSSWDWLSLMKTSTFVKLTGHRARYVRTRVNRSLQLTRKNATAWQIKEFAN